MNPPGSANALIAVSFTILNSNGYFSFVGDA
jgi:hypothetical protein